MASPHHCLEEPRSRTNASRPFNENEPIVHRPEEAVDCFLRTDMDVLAMGPWLVRKQGSADS